MLRSQRAVLVPLLLSLAVVGCTSSSGSPSPSSSDEASASASASASSSPTAEMTPAATATSAATAPPTQAPIISGEYLLVSQAFTVGEDLYQPQLWVIRPTGTGARKIAEGQAHGPLSPPNYNLDGVWSHDGSMVHVMKGCDSRLSNIAVHSWVETPVVNMGNKAAEFVWSPDDTKVAYFNYTNVQALICMQGTIPTTHDLMVMNADGSARTVVLHNTDWYPYWWPGASSVLLRDNPGWALMSIPGGAVTSLGISAWPAALSPDGASVAYISSGHLKVRAVTGGPVSDYGPGKDFAWSPDGESIAVTGTTLRVVTVATAASTTLYAHPTSLPTWSPDSMRVAFVKDHTDIYVQSITAASPKLVASGDEYIGDMQWQP